VLGAATGPLGEHFQYPFGCTRPPRSCTEECGRLSFESGALAAFNAMSFNSSLLCPRTLGSDAPSRTADIRLCTSVTVVCRPVPMLYPGRFHGRATGAHKGLDVEIVMGGSAVTVHREGPAGDHGAACALSPRSGNDRWIS
jgi:hypothetical protein